MAKSHLTKAEAGRAANFAAAVAAILGMARWRINIMEEPAPDDAAACIKPIEPYFRAEIKLNRNWSKEPLEMRFRTLVHEVCHLMHYQVDQVFDDAGLSMPDHEHEELGRHYFRATEYMVDLLAMYVEQQDEVRAAWDRIYGS